MLLFLLMLSLISALISPSTFLKTKKLFSIQVNQNPGKRVYLSESYGDKNAFNFRSEWYKVNDSLSTNTIKYAYFIFITDIKYWKKIQKKYKPVLFRLPCKNSSYRETKKWKILLKL